MPDKFKVYLFLRSHFSTFSHHLVFLSKICSGKYEFVSFSLVCFYISAELNLRVVLEGGCSPGLMSVQSTSVQPISVQSISVTSD